MPRTRIAPTPSGFIHEGNRLNFRRTVDLAAEWGAELALRIDDADAARYRREYAEDIFATLQDMGITWSVGPRDVDDFESRWSQRSKTSAYRDELAQARARGLSVYACTCSRSQQRGPATSGCQGGCRDTDPTMSGDAALRVRVEADLEVMVGDHVVPLGREMGDFVIWRRDDLPSSHLVTVVEDRDARITHIVRGEDLLAATAAQMYIAPFFDATNVVAAHYVHHELLRDSNGAKISKSTLAHREER